jgi:hypothetical protein
MAIGIFFIVTCFVIAEQQYQNYKELKTEWEELGLSWVYDEFIDKRRDFWWCMGCGFWITFLTVWVYIDLL